MNDLHGIDGLMDRMIRPILPGFSNFCGPARTVKWGPKIETAGNRGGGSSQNQLYNDMVESLKPGDVLVMHFGDMESETAPLGDNRVFGIKLKGTAGIVSDGLARDLPLLKRDPIPIFARGVTPRAHGAKPLQAIALDVEIYCGGVKVCPGDIICADEDSAVVVVPRDLAEQILNEAMAISEIDAEIHSRLAAGMPISEAVKPRSQENMLKHFPTWGKFPLKKR
jgi:5-oxopent-3-ene-1,2,5-tricarboxylate decarboxylase/2-hydroxyhepta-2,4-diene-1,7-dioate isomerase